MYKNKESKIMISLKKPPMGWNSYDYYDTTVNEEQVKKNADYMAEHLREHGWEYIVVDIEWYSYGVGTQREKHQYIPFWDVEMDEYSRLLPCPERFPSAADGKGFGPLADYVHGKGLKFGIHIMRGIPRIAAHNHGKILGSDHTANEIASPYNICYWNPDMYGVIPDEEGAQEYYDSLMQLYAEWGVDFVKCDDICRLDMDTAKEEIAMLNRAIQKCGRDIVLSLSPGPAIPDIAEYYHENANMWRITDDFWDSWDALRDMFDRCKTWQEYVRDGGYPDCDMLPLGFIGKGFGDERKTNFTKAEQRTMMTLWSIFRSPMMLGAELPKLDEWTLSLITNDRVLKLLERSSAAREVYRDEEVIAWQSNDRLNDRIYTAVFNISDKELDIVPKKHMTKKANHGVELWSGESADLSEKIPVKAHDCLLFESAD
jgi:hypothetical protein